MRHENKNESRGEEGFNISLQLLISLIISFHSYNKSLNAMTLPDLRMKKCRNPLTPAIECVEQQQQ